MKEVNFVGGKCRSEYRDLLESTYSGSLYSSSLPYNNMKAADIAKADSSVNECNKLGTSEAYFTDYNTK